MAWVLEKKKEKSKGEKRAKMGIMAFETGKTMSKLVSLYNSVSDEQISSLTNEVPRSKGILYLNSMDEGLVLSLACTERLEDLDKVAAIVTRLGHNKCSTTRSSDSDPVFKRLHDLLVYSDRIRKLNYGSKGIEKRVEKMKKMIATTCDLYTALALLTELEVSEKKLKQWKDKMPPKALELEKKDFHVFNERIEQQRKQVNQLREKSLWNQTFDKSVSLMASIVCVLYARICLVFAPYIPPTPTTTVVFRSQSVCHSDQRHIRRERAVQLPKFGGGDLEPPLLKKQSILQKVPFMDEWKWQRKRNNPSLLLYKKEEEDFAGAKALKNNKIFHAAGASTVGGCGLALRYANIIAMAENFLYEDYDTTRDYLYQLLPNNLKTLVRSKLIKNMKDPSSDAGEDELLAAGWRVGMNEIMGWLAPMAHHTIQWQMERSPEKTIFDDSKPKVLLLQTLHFSDKDKTEAAIAEVLVALSCICKYDSILHSNSTDSHQK